MADYIDDADAGFNHRPIPPTGADSERMLKDAEYIRWAETALKTLPLGSARNDISRTAQETRERLRAEMGSRDLLEHTWPGKLRVRLVVGERNSISIEFSDA